VPALRERKDDIPALINHFCDKICNEYNVPPKTFESRAIKQLQKPSWSGNIRELRNVVERLIILSKDTVTYKDVQNFVSTSRGPSSGLDRVIDKFDTLEQLQEYISQIYNNREQVYTH